MINSVCNSFSINTFFTVSLYNNSIFNTFLLYQKRKKITKLEVNVDIMNITLSNDPRAVFNFAMMHVRKFRMAEFACRRCF